MTKKYQEYVAKVVPALACGRTADEQAEFIKTHGNHGVPAVLRGGLFKAMGIPSPKERAENVVVFGCYVPFVSPFLVRDYVQLLERIGVDYTYLQQEYCCGAPIPLQTPEDERENAVATARDVARINVDAAAKKGAHTLAYCCTGCVHLNKYVSPPGEAGNHRYIADLVVDKLKDVPLKVAPMKVGYYEGCHAYYNQNYPKARVTWKRYRELLGNVEGLQIVDLPSKDRCCKIAPAKIVEDAHLAGVDTILSTCNSCYAGIGDATKGSIRMMSFPEVILKGLPA